jgi:hypothetical protein
MEFPFQVQVKAFKSATAHRGGVWGLSLVDGGGINAIDFFRLCCELADMGLSAPVSIATAVIGRFFSQIGNASFPQVVATIDDFGRPESGAWLQASGGANGYAVDVVVCHGHFPFKVQVKTGSVLWAHRERLFGRKPDRGLGNPEGAHKPLDCRLGSITVTGGVIDS